MQQDFCCGMLGKRRDLTLESHLKIKSEATIRVLVLEPHAFVMHHAFIMENVYSSSDLSESLLNVDTSLTFIISRSCFVQLGVLTAKAQMAGMSYFGNRTP